MSILQNGELVLGPPPFSNGQDPYMYTHEDTLFIRQEIIKGYIKNLLRHFSTQGQKVKVDFIHEQVNKEYPHFKILVSPHFIRAFLARALIYVKST